tara:strand:+ start:2359 stop:3198 length:840 start_codon:yes stop_codon:yes gene_type:complete
VKEVKIQDISISNNTDFVLISGLNVLEDEPIITEVIEELKRVTDELGIPFIFKASYDKANRSSVDSYRGPGLEKGLRILEKIKTDYKVPIISDVHSPEEVDKVKDVLDILQIPAFLCRQTDLISSAALTGLAVNIKKGQFLSPNEVKNIISKFKESNNANILICERGTTFGYNNLVVDMLGLAELKLSNYPVIFDVTHSLQQPGGGGKNTSGRRHFALDLAKSAMSLGLAGLFLETHPNPAEAKCDGPCALPLKLLKPFLEQISAIDNLVKDLPEIEIT